VSTWYEKGGGGLYILERVKRLPILRCVVDHHEPRARRARVRGLGGERAVPAPHKHRGAQGERLQRSRDACVGRLREDEGAAERRREQLRRRDVVDKEARAAVALRRRARPRSGAGVAVCVCLAKLIAVRTSRDS
jgi:hypothetical protein